MSICFTFVLFINLTIKSAACISTNSMSVNHLVVLKVADLRDLEYFTPKKDCAEHVLILQVRPVILLVIQQ